MHFSEGEQNATGAVRKRNWKPMKIRIRLILWQKCSTLQVQADDLLTRFFDFGNMKPNSIHPRKIRRPEDHYGQLNVELTPIKKCLIHTSVREVLKFFKRDAESTEQRGRINMDAIWATPDSMGKKLEVGCVWVLTKCFKTEDHITSR